MKWLRLYSEVLDDPKVQRLPGELFKTYFMDIARAEPSPDNPFIGLVEGPFDRPPMSVWIVTRQRIFNRDAFTCQYCGAVGGKLECDHIVPVSRGGSHGDENLATACFTCNRSKRAKTVEEWTR
jgi:hypothetical protein